MRWVKDFEALPEHSIGENEEHHENKKVVKITDLDSNRVSSKYKSIQITQ